MWHGPFGMWGNAVDEEAEGERHHLIYWRGWLHKVPRAFTCRRFGHVPIVDGYGKPGETYGGPGSASRCKRWVACRRCDVRPTWQGDLPPALYPTLGARYDGPWTDPADLERARRADEAARDRYYAAMRERADADFTGEPIPQPESVIPAWPSVEWGEPPTGGLSFDLLVWQRERRDFPGYGVGFSIGTGERPLKGHVHAGRLGSVYVGFEDYGRALANRLLGRNLAPTRVFEIDLDVRRRTLRWEFAARKHEWSSRDPKWMSGHVDFAQLVFGKVIRGEHVIDMREVMLPLPEGRYPATVELHRTISRRERFGRPMTTYAADVKPVCGVPVPGKGENSYDCGDDAIYAQWAPVSTPEHGSEWVTEAVSKFVSGVLRQRSRYGGGLAYVPADGWPEQVIPA